MMRKPWGGGGGGRGEGPGVPMTSPPCVGLQGRCWHDERLRSFIGAGCDGAGLLKPYLEIEGKMMEESSRPAWAT